MLDIEEITVKQFINLCPSFEKIYYFELEEKQGLTIEQLSLLSTETKLDNYFKNSNSKTKRQPTNILDEIVKKETQEKSIEKFRARKGLK